MGLNVEQLNDDEKKILLLPVQITCEKDYIAEIKQRLSKYQDLINGKKWLEENTEPYLMTQKLCTVIPECLELYVAGKISDANHKLKKILDELKLYIKRTSNCIWLKYISDVEDTERHCRFYRSRNIKTNDTNDLKHIPFDKLHITSSQRFTYSGCADLYLSYTKNACMGEIGNNGTIAEFLLKDPHTIKVFDMSAFKLNCAKHFQDDQRKEQLIVIWPLIAACNSIAYCCPVSKKECQSIKRNFKIEYVIPQMFAAYLKSKNTVDGIRYYTVRDENLDPKAINMMDIVLFTKYSSETHYDEELLTKFDISIVPDN